MRRSRPTVVLPPCPGQTTVSSGKLKSTVRIDVSSVSRFPPGRLVRPIAAREQRVADDQRAGRIRVSADRQAHAAGGVPRRVTDPGGVLPEPPRTFVVEVEVDRRLRLHFESERDSLLHGSLIQELVGAV